MYSFREKINKPCTVLIFILLIFVFFSYLTNQFLLYGLSISKTEDYGIWSSIINKNIDADILAVGNSRTLVHYYPDLLSKEFGNQNVKLIGLSGNHYKIIYSAIRKYLQKNKPPKISIIETDYYLLSGSEKISNVSQFLPYLDDSMLYNSLLKFEKQFYYYKHLPLFGLCSQGIKPVFYSISSILGKNYIEYTNGYYKTNENWRADSKRNAEIKYNKFHYNIDPNAVINLKDIILLFKSSGTKVILVNSPTYFEIQNYINFQSILNNELFKISTEMNVPYWDYTDSTICKEQKYFYNYGHMNFEGAKAFSKILSEKLKKEEQ